MKSTVVSLASRTVRFLTNEVADALEKRAVRRPLELPADPTISRMKIDIPDAARQLGSADARVQLHQLMSRNHR